MPAHTSRQAMMAMEQQTPMGSSDIFVFSVQAAMPVVAAFEAISGRRGPVTMS